MGNGSKSPSPTATLDPPEVDLEDAGVPAEGDELDLGEGANDDPQMVEVSGAAVEETYVNPEDVVVWNSGQELLDAQQQTADILETLNTNSVDFQQEDGDYLPTSEAFDHAVMHGMGVDADTFGEVYEQWTTGEFSLPEWQTDLNEAAAKWIDAQNDPNLSLGEKYAALSEYGETARNILDAQGLEGSDHFDALKANTQGWLNGLSPAELREVAHSAGFQHPLLVSGGNPNDTSGKNALAFALDPAYDPNLIQKQKIQQSALNRYDKLTSGQSAEVNGVSLADVDADDAKHGAAAPTSAASGLAPIVVGQAELLELQAAKEELGQGFIGYSKKLAAIEHNFKLAAAAPTGGVTQADIDALKLDPGTIAFYNTASGTSDQEKFAELVGISTDQFKLADHEEKATLANPWADQAQVDAAKQSLATKLDTAHDAVAASVSAATVWQAHKNGKIGQDLTADDASQLINNWAKSHQADAPTQTLDVSKQAMQDAGLASAAGWSPPQAKQLRAWMKDQPLKELRTVAGNCGMPEDAAKVATRAQIQNYLIHKAKGQETTAAGVVSQALTKAEAKAAAKASGATAATSGVSDATVAKAAPKVSKPVVTNAKAMGEKVVIASYKKQLDDLSAHLQQGLAAEEAIPKRNPQAVSGLSFSQNQAYAPSGGSHTVVGYAASDGTKWFAKPYGASGGAPRAKAEAVASEVKDSLGLETVPVYHMKVDGKDVAMQPLVSNASTLSGMPVQSMSQADVDTVVRHQVGDWLIGDHDGNESNWMRTESGALFRIDHGQAFKFYGADRLSTDYEPNGNYGTPVFQQVMKAQKGGSLPSGATVNPGAALGVIEKAEAIPDAKWREMMRPVAESGASNGDIAWVPRMRKAAAKKHGVAEAQVSKDQVIDAFLDHAVERKNNARKSFLGLFNDAGLSGGALGATKD